MNEHPRDKDYVHLEKLVYFSPRSVQMLLLDDNRCIYLYCVNFDEMVITN